MSLRKLITFATKGISNPNGLTRSFSLHKLSDEHLMLQKTCRDFAETELKPIAAELDKNHKFPAEQIKKMGELGLLAINVPEKIWRLWARFFSISGSRRRIGQGMWRHWYYRISPQLFIQRCGTEEQKEKFLRPFTNGTLGCFALSEPDAGSDVGGISTTAVLNGDCYVLNGTKSWVTSAIEGKAAIVFASIDRSLKHKGISGFIVPLPSPGLSLEDVRIPKENLLGTVGGGF
ncbi:hypothetical protein NQ317_000277 [Molorchus minor]|uniref:Uncharacterized protein n=1 Tax=Molorchus minor TaxID=1323400 RepID=A0ABQ9JB39_9CUCU|nr:hypothetical protein NQ317_000277 [Molorchus minor]